MTISLGARAARSNFSHLLGQVHYGGQTVIIERSGRPMVAMIPAEMFRQLVAEREARFQVLDRMRARLPEIPAEEVVQDVAEALAAVKRDAARRA